MVSPFPAVYFVFVVFWTNHGVFYLPPIQVEDEVTCIHQAGDANKIFYGKDLPFKDENGEEVKALVLFADGMCNVSYKKDSA